MDLEAFKSAYLRCMYLHPPKHSFFLGMQLKSSFPFNSANSEKLLGANSLCGIGVTQRDQRSLELTHGRYPTHHSLLYITWCEDSSASSWSPLSHCGHIQFTWREKGSGRQGCRPLSPWHVYHLTLRLTLAKAAIGSWWHKLTSCSKIHHLFPGTTLENM